MSIVFENEKFILTIGDDAVTESLVLKEGGIDVLDHYEEMPIFSLTEPAPSTTRSSLHTPTKRPPSRLTA